jgi:hypothetical protein
MRVALTGAASLRGELFQLDDKGKADFCAIMRLQRASFGCWSCLTFKCVEFLPDRRNNVTGKEPWS